MGVGSWPCLKRLSSRIFLKALQFFCSMFWKKHKKLTQEVEPDGKVTKGFWFGRNVSRNLGPLISVPIIKYTNITPNQVTLAMIFVGLVGSYLFTFGSQPFIGIAGFLLLFHYILDVADGEVARARKMTSNQGRYLDLVGDNIVKFCMFLGLGIGAYNMEPAWWPFQQEYLLILGATAGFGFFLGEFAFLGARMLKVEGKKFKKINKYKYKQSSLANKMLNLIKKIYGYSFVVFFRGAEMYFILFFISLVGYTDYFLVFYGILAPLNGIFRFVNEYYLV